MFGYISKTKEFDHSILPRVGSKWVMTGDSNAVLGVITVDSVQAVRNDDEADPRSWLIYGYSEYDKIDDDLMRWGLIFFDVNMVPA